MTSPFSPEATTEPPQRVVKIRRDYNTWVANETLEDYALRFTPRSFRKWSEMRVANTAFGASSFLVLEAVGATMLVNGGFINAFWAILATGLIIFLIGLPISHAAARYGLDMDLLTRGAGFGYIGSTVTSLIYASFTFIFFALEAAIMAYALELAFHIPPAWGYLICALVVIPLVTHGVTAISRLQAWTQPLWLALLILPYAFLLWQEPEVLSELTGYAGEKGLGGAFSMPLFGAALTVGIALVTQMGEQADYLRFMPERTAKNRNRWWLALVLGGPGWVLPGVAKMLGGALLAYLALRNAVPVEKAVDPNQMYLIGFSHVFSNTSLAIAATVLFVVISQLKINVTNAYAGSLAWSNFFARLTHSHPGRVVWVVFNILIALLLMELDVFQALGQILGLYSNIAISWMAAVVADLVINKPLGLSPPHIEFKRSHLYDINPVGIGAMCLASLLSIAAFSGLLGPDVQPYASFIALSAAFVAAPLIAWITGGRYYLVANKTVAAAGMQRCCICEREYESEDTAHCPAYRGTICSLCCSLDARCDDLCKPGANLAAQWNGTLRRILPAAAIPYLETGLGHYLLLMVCIVPLLAGLLGLLYTHETLALGPEASELIPHLQQTFIKAFSALLLFAGVGAWWMVLTHKSRQVAQEESNRQTRLLLQEIDSHQRTDEQLQKAKLAADQANQAKSRYITAISHELRTPLNSILGYAQILAGDEAIPAHRRQAVGVIRKSGDHLLSVIEGTLDIARIEGGKLTLEVKALDFPEFLQQIVGMFELQARNKGLSFSYEPVGELPGVVRVDQRRLQQILINVLGNAVKFTVHGGVNFRVECRREMAIFDIRDSGPGIPPEDLERIFEPFVRGSQTQAGGSGVGLTIARMLTDLMGGEMTVSSIPGEGSSFRIRLFLPQVHSAQAEHDLPRTNRIGYVGIRRRILVVDNEKVDRDMLQSVLDPLGFQVEQAASGHECLQVLPRFAPHLVFMDLAMPGIDGWETIRRIRQQNLTDAHIAIISANAFDRGLENDAGIGNHDFIVKPLRVDELLDWIGRKLSLEWVSTESPVIPPARVVPKPAQLIPPGQEHLSALDELVGLGYVRGILNKLGEIERLDPAHGEFVRVLRDLARQFQFDAMKEILGKGRDVE
ncbi:Response regulator receiver:ATP-binding region, ATPase-like:Histidine kinase A, N-terminal [Candidatus Propionivibrio aalborgensis]|uniref:histidine kinase n=1 Tax=Candidatus Propionivibrio aalborgensis TaxID=1860101 RepID=A0A1A8XPE4_9RHOO|nr:ATP-binding protein [Candidatus Propionivibrio aalborgensis]SBT06516.1 Response regulator receiver:ATP-binding region, ATPase-like:Histidine kinase A, N-terminal [Candidatus Propionivibrio aalborgensis]